jgi:hypothetical protein
MAERRPQDVLPLLWPADVAVIVTSAVVAMTADRRRVRYGRSEDAIGQLLARLSGEG